jgi:hypothetical protein
VVVLVVLDLMVERLGKRGNLCGIRWNRSTAMQNGAFHSVFLAVDWNGCVVLVVLPLEHAFLPLCFGIAPPLTLSLLACDARDETMTLKSPSSTTNNQARVMTQRRPVVWRLFSFGRSLCFVSTSCFDRRIESFVCCVRQEYSSFYGIGERHCTSSRWWLVTGAD